jgi:hypothetical protein
MTVVIPAKAGIHSRMRCGRYTGSMDSRFRGNDGRKEAPTQ